MLIRKGSCEKERNDKKKGAGVLPGEHPHSALKVGHSL